MNMKAVHSSVVLIAMAGGLVGCSDSKDLRGTHTHADGSTHAADHATPETQDHGSHVHDDGSVHTDHGSSEMDPHQTRSLGVIEIGGKSFEISQSHGNVEAHKEMHISIRPVDGGQGNLVVRAWIGSADRSESMVGLGEYSSSSNAYDIHTSAPSTIANDTMWWIEVQRPDGSLAVGSIRPLMN